MIYRHSKLVERDGLLTGLHFIWESLIMTVLRKRMIILCLTEYAVCRFNDSNFFPGFNFRLLLDASYKCYTRKNAILGVWVFAHNDEYAEEFDEKLSRVLGKASGRDYLKLAAFGLQTFQQGKYLKNPFGIRPPRHAIIRG